MIAPDARLYIAGHSGLVGSALWRYAEAAGARTLLGHRSSEVDLRDADAAMDAITTARPDVLVLAAARVGGILANSAYPVEFLNDNLAIQTNVFRAAHAAGVEQLLFLGSSCIYPRLAPQPIPESALLTGPLEPTNQAYALAKIAGIVAVQSYRSEYSRRWISAMPTNLYGPGDSFDPQTSHVMPAMIRRFVEAADARQPSVTLWGTGSPRREFLHADDLAAACFVLLDHYDDDIAINVGTGTDLPIRELAGMVAQAAGFEGETLWDSSKPDGTPRKVLDISRIAALGWTARIGLADGIGAEVARYRADRAGSSVS